MRTVVIAVAVISFVACSHAQPAPAVAAVAPPPAPVQVIAEPEPAPVPEPVVAEAPPPQMASLYFDFDSDELVPSARAALQAFFDEAQKNPGERIRIEGNCDERGSEEYNIALGQRRADVAKRYLVNLGFPADRIATTSYGSERPRAAGHEEEAWKENRRDDLLPSAGDTSNAVSAVSR
jgi:peptidoglycan-associated lipoprotein